VSSLAFLRIIIKRTLIGLLSSQLAMPPRNGSLRSGGLVSFVSHYILSPKSSQSHRCPRYEDTDRANSIDHNLQPAGLHHSGVFHVPEEVVEPEESISKQEALVKFDEFLTESCRVRHPRW
jgi:hypothetical protein